jgi:hypothetical protein
LPRGSRRRFGEGEGVVARNLAAPDLLGQQEVPGRESSQAKTPSTAGRAMSAVATAQSPSTNTGKASVRRRLPNDQAPLHE